MVTGAKRQKELARAKYERQQARRAAATARRRRRQQAVAAGVAVIVVIAGMVYLTQSLGAGEDTTPHASGCSYNEAGRPNDKSVGMPPEEPDKSPAVAAIKTNRGTVTATLLAEKAPCTVASLEFLAGKDFFDKTKCHRLTATASLSVLQCGDPSGTGSGGPGYQFADENLDGATYPRGTLAMANAGPGTNGSQFFLVYKDSQLPPNYTPFGTITSGLEVIDAIAKVGIEGGDDGAPKQPVIIESLTVERTA